MRRRDAVGLLAACALALLVFAPSAFGASEICPPGTAAGKCTQPEGLAVDNETGNLYVADRGNNRIDVFDSSGTFVMAFGWGVVPATSGFGKCTTVTGCQAGSVGTGAGQFDFGGEGATSIAVDNNPASPSFRDLYVVDFANQRVQRFSPTGDFELMFGGTVNTGTSGEPDICTAAGPPSDVCGAGTNGTGAGEFGSSENARVFVAVGPGGTVYVAEGRNFEKNRVQKFDPEGHFTEQIALPDSNQSMSAFAVDSTGNLYYAIGGSGQPDTGLHKTDPAGTPIPSYFKKRVEVRALAVDAGDELLSTGPEKSFPATVIEYDATGATLRNFGYGDFTTNVSGLAPYHSPSGDLYVSEGDRVRYLAFPDPGPIAPSTCKAPASKDNPNLTEHNTKVTLNSEVNPEGKASKFHFEYLTEEQFVNGEGFEHEGIPNPAIVSTPETPVPLANPTDPEEAFKLQQVSAANAPVVPETTYRCRVVVEDVDGASASGLIGEFTTPKPVEFGPSWSVGVKSDSARLETLINPKEIPTTAYFEYLSEAQFQANGEQFTGAQKTPTFPLGSGNTFALGGAALTGLAPGTTYHYRVIAVDSYYPDGIADPTEPDLTFKTYPTAPSGTPDGRRYELVSPALKNSAEVAVPGTAGGLADETSVRIEAAGASGEAITYTSWTSFGNGQSAPSTSQYLSRRGGGGWSTANVSPYGFLKNPVRPPYRGFTGPDLGFGAFVTDEPPLAAGCQVGFENLYLRDSVSGQLHCLTNSAPVKSPEEAKTFCIGYAGAATDGSRAFFAANASLTPDAPVGKGFSLYEWSASNGLKLVSILPGAPETPAAPQAASAFAAKGGGCGMGEKRPAISADGTRAFWTYAPASGSSMLLARINGTKTIQLDAKASGGTGAGDGVFEGASDDGSVALFTDANKLIAGSGAKASEPDLYRYDLNAGGGTGTLSDLTPGSLTPGTETANVRGVVGTSADGSYVYFVANGVLSGEEENEAGQKAQSGEPNLYLFHEGEAGVRFIATLDKEDSLDWDPAPRARSAQVSADGQHLAFSSIATEALAAGYDNTIAAGEHCQPTAEVDVLNLSPHCPQAFLYDAGSEELDCVSCNPSGSRPLGPIQFPTASNPYGAPRYLAPDGKRLFFESRDALLAEDENGKRDAYEFERSGTGDCKSTSPSYSPVSEGCLYLLSTGKSPDESFLLDASADARDVFIATRQVLVGWDINENYDVYDFRAGGGFPEPGLVPPPCEGEGCKLPVPEPPAPVAPAFQGPGNVKHKHHKKKHRKHGKGKKHQKPAKHKRGASR